MSKEPTDSANDDKTVRVVKDDKTRIQKPITGADDEATIVVNPTVSAVSTPNDDETVITSNHSPAPSQDDATQQMDDQATDQTLTGVQQSPVKLGLSSKTSFTSHTQSVTETRNPLTNTMHKSLAAGGDAIKDRFIIKKVLGEGGMGMVCQALDLRKVEAEDESPHIAIKLLTSSFQNHPNAFKSLQREAKKTQALAHPNIITVYDFDRDGDAVFMTMEELDGYPLDAIIKGRTEIDLQKEPKTAIKIVKEIAQALEYAHSKGIIHSDLKPGNIFYTKTGQTKVLDFGIARALNNELYKDDYDAGELNALTPKYASLEMFHNEPPDPTDDIYALGLIAGQLLGGKHPFDGKSANEAKEQSLKPQFDNKLGRLYKRLISNAIALHGSDRTASATDFLSQLQWAEKGPRRLLLASSLVLVLAVANAFIIESVDDEIPLSDLPQADQQKVLLNISEADTALKFQDFNGALVYLDRAYQIHPSNHDVEDRASDIVKVFETQIKKSQDDNDQRSYLVKQLSEIGNYEFISVNKNYQQLYNKFQ